MQYCKQGKCLCPSICHCRKVRESYKPIIWVLGPPGSGVNQQIEKIVDEFHFTHLHVGNVLREEVSEGTLLSKNIKEYLAIRAPVPEEMVIRIIHDRMKKALSYTKGFIIQAYPKTVDQGEEFEKYIAPVDLVINFKCSFENAFPRIKKSPSRECPTYDVKVNDIETIRGEYNLRLFHDNRIAEKYDMKLVYIVCEDYPDQETYLIVRRHIEDLLEEKKFWKHQDARYAKKLRSPD